jgi:hypothetical protein
MRHEVFLQRLHHVQRAVKTILIHLLCRDPQKVPQRAFATPTLGNVKLRRGTTEPRHGQHTRHLRPVHILPSGRYALLEKRVQPQPPPQRKPKIHVAEASHAFDSHPGKIDRRPRRGGWMTKKQIRMPPRLPVQNATDLLPADPLLLVETGPLAQHRHGPLPRSFRRAHRLNQRPRLVFLSAFAPNTSLQIHRRSLPSILGKIYPLRRCSSRRWSPLHAVSGKSDVHFQCLTNKMSPNFLRKPPKLPKMG